MNEKYLKGGEIMTAIINMIMAILEAIVAHEYGI
jgi:hypothetical protein